MSAYLGGAWTRPADLIISQPASATSLTFHHLPFSGRPFQLPVYYGYRAGAFLRKHFGFEGEFIHLKIYANLDQPVRIQGTLRGSPISVIAPLAIYAQQFEIAHGLNMLLGNVVTRQPLGRFTVTLDWKQQNRVFADVNAGTEGLGRASLTGIGEPEAV